MIDWDRVSELQAEVGADGITEVIEIFLEEMDEGLNGLANTSDAGAILERLHFLKGSAQNIGLSEVSALCAAWEDAVKADASARPDISEIRGALDRARADLGDLAA